MDEQDLRFWNRTNPLLDDDVFERRCAERPDAALLLGQFREASELRLKAESASGRSYAGWLAAALAAVLVLWFAGGAVHRGVSPDRAMFDNGSAAFAVDDPTASAGRRLAAVHRAEAMIRSSLVVMRDQAQRRDQVGRVAEEVQLSVCVALLYPEDLLDVSVVLGDVSAAHSRLRHASSSVQERCDALRQLGRECVRAVSSIANADSLSVAESREVGRVFSSLLRLARAAEAVSADAGIPSSEVGSCTLSVTPQVLVVGSGATVDIAEPSKAGQVVYVQVTDDHGHAESLQVQLDGNGKGRAEWRVPQWGQARFEFGAADPVVVSIIRHS